ncbi:MAG: M23 family metallopeptidase [Cyanobacteria bacterium J06614_10]
MTPPSSNFSASKATSRPEVSSADGPPTASHPVTAEPKRPCRVTVTAPGWNGARMAAIAAGCSSVSDMLEKLGRGELAIITSDAIALDPVANSTFAPDSYTARAAAANASVVSSSAVGAASPTTVVPQHVHYHAANPVVVSGDGGASGGERAQDAYVAGNGLAIPKLIATGLCGAVIIGSLLYIADRVITMTANILTPREDVEDIVTPLTGEVVAGYAVSDEYGIRPFHPVTGAPNVPHNGVDLAMPIGTPIYAVGKAGDAVTVKCWWDVDGGGWVVDQTAESYPGYTFQSLHMSENGCREGKAMAGEAIAYSGNSGLGTGEHYDFRVKIDGAYVPPATKYLESAVTGEPPKE